MIVGLFGGSFDPIHHGHLITGMILKERLGLDEVRFMPARAQPLKPGHGATVTHRIHMVELALEGAAGLGIERADVDRAGPSFTAETLRILHDREPETEWVLLIGADAARDLGSWRDAEALPGLARLVSFNRAATPPPAAADLDQMPVPVLDISATDIRRRVRLRLPIRYMVPPAVERYIDEHRLYRGEAG